MKRLFYVLFLITFILTTHTTYSRNINTDVVSDNTVVTSLELQYSSLEESTAMVMTRHFNGIKTIGIEKLDAFDIMVSGAVSTNLVEGWFSNGDFGFWWFGGSVHDNEGNILTNKNQCLLDAKLAYDAIVYDDINTSPLFYWIGIQGEVPVYNDGEIYLDINLLNNKGERYYVSPLTKTIDIYNIKVVDANNDVYYNTPEKSAHISIFHGRYGDTIYNFKYHNDKWYYEAYMFSNDYYYSWSVLLKKIQVKPNEFFIQPRSLICINSDVPENVFLKIPVK